MKILDDTGLENVILVTHGEWIDMFFRLVLKTELQKKENCGWVLLEGESGVYKVLNSNGIS